MSMLKNKIGVNIEKGVLANLCRSEHSSNIIKRILLDIK